MMPCRPPTMFVSIVGQAIFQTAGASGPSTIERSYRRASLIGGRGPLVAATGLVARTGVLIDVRSIYGAEPGAADEFVGLLQKPYSPEVILSKAKDLLSASKASLRRSA